MTKLTWWRRPTSVPVLRDMRDVLDDLGIDRFFDKELRRSGRGVSFVPAIEVVERDSGYLIRADLPGIRAEDVHVRVEDDVLIISGERHREEGTRERGYEYTERSYGTFMRSIELPTGADPSSIEAEHRDGVLEVRAAKRPRQARQISVRSAGPRRGDEPVGRVVEPGNGNRREADRERPHANATAMP